MQTNSNFISVLSIRRIHWAMIVWCASIFVVKSVSAAPQEWSVNGHAYEVIGATEGITWEAARDAAIAKGGYLATITSKDENTFVHGLIATDASYWVTIGTAPNNSSSGPWLGLYQPAGSEEPAGGWTWVTGEPLSYANWTINRPNNVEGIEDYGQFFGLGIGNFADTWNDLPNQSTDLISIVAVNPRAYIVEYNGVPEPSAWTGLTTAGLCLGAWRRRMRPGKGVRTLFQRNS